MLLKTSIDFMSLFNIWQQVEYLCVHWRDCLTHYAWKIIKTESGVPLIFSFSHVFLLHVRKYNPNKVKWMKNMQSLKQWMFIRLKIFMFHFILHLLLWRVHKLKLNLLWNEQKVKQSLQWTSIRLNRFRYYRNTSDMTWHEPKSYSRIAENILSVSFWRSWSSFIQFSLSIKRQVDWPCVGCGWWLWW